MRANKVDNNHAQIVDELREAGYSVLSLASLKNACDILVYKNGVYRLFEIKSPEYCHGICCMSQSEREKFLTIGEERFSRDFPVFIVINSEEIKHIMS